MRIATIAPALLVGFIAIFSGCDGDENTNTLMQSTHSYSVKILNLTAGQPMSPLLVSSASLFNTGTKASPGLEYLAEGGDNSKLLDTDSVSGTKIIVPGAYDTVIIQSQNSKISLATMLVKTNDGFAGLDSYDVSKLALNESVVVYASVYDAGTELNDELSTSVPGLGGEGFNVARELSDIVTMHSGVVSNEDGLVTSGLSAMEKFNNPVAAVTIIRTK
jgi:hypothetical protein